MTILGAEHGFLEVEPHTPQLRRADRRVVLLLHGLGGSKDDWRFPAGRGVHWDHRHDPPDRHSNNHLTPPLLPPFPPFGLSAMRTDIRCWSGVLKALGHTVINYTQDGRGDVVEVPLAQLEGRIAPFIREDVLTDQLAGKRVVLLCHSRGGILARRYLREHADASEWIGRVITLLSPHQGTEAPRAKQRLADAAAVLGAGVTSGASLAVDLVLRITGLLESGDGANQLLPDDPLFDPLLDRLADPADVPDIAFSTFGGTSVRYGRIYSWHYTPASLVPNVLDFPDLRFDWTQVPFEERLASPLLDAIPDAIVEDEQDEGEGDGLVANQRARLPGAPHRSVAVNHSEALWDENLFAEVADLLGTPLSGAGPVDCGRPEITHTLTIQPAFVSFGSVNIGTTVTRTLRIRNTTGNMVTVQLAASPPGVFEWAALNATLPAGEEASVQFRFRPVDHALRFEKVRFTSTAPGSPHTIGLSGKGPGGFDPDAEEPLPTSLSFRGPTGFGSVSIGDQATRVLTIGNNTGRIVNITIAASTGPVFSWPALTTAMGHETEQQLPVTFRPTDYDLEYGTLTVLSDTAASPDTIKLFGKGPGGFPIPEEDLGEAPLF